jgi:hypothetical protein
MPKTEVLNDPLAAEEIKEIIIDKIRAAMNRNSTLVDDLTYAGFRVKFEVKLEFVRHPTPGTLVWGDECGGEQKGDVDLQDASGEYESDPSPNKTREDNDLPLPVMVMTPSGPQKRRVRIQNAGKGVQK